MVVGGGMAKIEDLTADHHVAKDVEPAFFHFVDEQDLVEARPWVDHQHQDLRPPVPTAGLLPTRA